MNENLPASRTPRLRRLSTEEIELWLNVTQGVARRPGSGPLPRLRKDAELPASETGNNLAKGPLTPPSPVARKAPPSLVPLAPLERRLRQELARGRAAPDASLDLHGLRRQEAFAALREFLARAQIEGARLVLVVTGKGARTPSADGTSGVLRKSVPIWLRGPEYRAIVLGFEEASRPHGGAGALYVRLRRRDRPARVKKPP
ncbi:MAG: Smr/MutS family protein [Beijerinckiaceae bacterium]